jgi:hypothetical protein
MSILSQALNKISYQLHQATYDPEAEAYIKKQADEKQKEIDLANIKKLEEKEAKIVEAKKTAELKAIAEAKKISEEENKFDIGRLIGRIFAIIFMIFGIFLLCVFGVYGASLASNLNVHHDWPYRLVYALWGFVFFWIVIPYVLLYRWWWKGLQPRFYALIPLVPYKFDNKWMALFFSWLSYKPDTIINQLREWE